jgi:hypothetical protein
MRIELLKERSLRYPKSLITDPMPKVQAFWVMVLTFASIGASNRYIAGFKKQAMSI